MSENYMYMLDFVPFWKMSPTNKFKNVNEEKLFPMLLKGKTSGIFVTRYV